MQLFPSRNTLLFTLSPDDQVIKIFGEDGSNRLLEIPADATVRDVTQQLVLRVNCVEDSSWGLIEHMPNVGIGE